MTRSYRLPLRSFAVPLIAALVMAACAPGQAATPTPPPPSRRPPMGTATPPSVDLATSTPPPAAEQPTPTPGVPSMTEPPPAALSIGGQSQLSGIGSYCWNTSGDPAQGMGLCVDKMGLITPLEPMLVPAGPLTAEFQLPLDDALSEALLTVYPAQGKPSVFGEVQGWEPNFDAAQTHTLALVPEQSITLEFEPGLYVLSVFVRWEGWGDVLYGFLVQVGEGQGG